MLFLKNTNNIERLFTNIFNKNKYAANDNAYAFAFLHICFKKMNVMITWF